MKNFPVIPHAWPRLSALDQDRIAPLARRLEQQESGLKEHPLPRITAEALESWPRLLLEDASSLREPRGLEDRTSFLDRARLRAGNQDLVICPNPIPGSYEDYCRDSLGLGTVEWLQPQGSGNPRHVADLLMSDSSSWKLTLDWVRRGSGVVVDSYLSNFRVWRMAERLRDESGRPVMVLGAPPLLTDWVNNKARFTQLVWSLFGVEAMPRTWIESQLPQIAHRVAGLRQETSRIVVKTPDSAGGAGNLTLRSADYRNLSEETLAAELGRRLEELRWTPGVSVVISPWLEEVQCSPSAQLWIPTGGDPIVEGVFEQRLIGKQAEFCGSRPARLPDRVFQEIVDRSWMLGRLFQHLGYLGRCSFDLLVVGRTAAESRSLFVECNGRWGGTSLPMTLMNRLFGDWQEVSYAARPLVLPGLARLGFEGILRSTGNRLFDCRDRRGHLVFFNPSRIAKGQGIEVVAIASSLLAADQRLFRAGQLLGWIAAAANREPGDPAAPSNPAG